MNALEKHLNMQLFDRTNHGILLTPAGKVIYKHAKILFEYSEKAIEEARQAMTADLVTFLCRYFYLKSLQTLYGFMV